MLIFVEMQIALGLLIFLAEHAVRGGELGHDQPAAVEIADEAAEDGVGNAGHGSQHGRGGDSDIADQKACGDRLRWCGLADRSVRPTRTRVVPELLHVAILLPPASGKASWSVGRPRPPCSSHSDGSRGTPSPDEASGAPRSSQNKTLAAARA